MLNGTFVCLNSRDLHSKGVMFTIGCLQNIVENLKDKEIKLENGAGIIRNFRLDGDRIIADFELNFKVSSTFIPIKELTTAEGIRIVDARLMQSYLVPEKIIIDSFKQKDK